MSKNTGTKPSRASKKRAKRIKFASLPVVQGNHKLYCFVAPAQMLWGFVQVNRRNPDKDEGYQRVLSSTRLAAIKRYVSGGNPIPNSILISLDQKHTKIEDGGRTVVIQEVSDAGWVIDGQHRLYGAHASGQNIDFVVIAYVGLSPAEQIEEFVTINREAKGVPASLYLDLLKHLPKSSEADLTKQRSADIASSLRLDENSPFFGRIVVVSAPKRGEISLTNFVRKVNSLVQKKGPLSSFSMNEQRGIIDNYFKALQNTFPNQFEGLEPLVFQTLGFGALINALPTVLNLALKNEKGFTVADATKILKKIGDFPFDEWKKIGSGSAAEISAGNEFEQALRASFESTGEYGTIKL